MLLKLARTTNDINISDQMAESAQLCTQRLAPARQQGHQRVRKVCPASETAIRETAQSKVNLIQLA